MSAKSPAMKLHPVTRPDRSGPDRRYSVALEWCGQSTPRYVARFCGEWIGQSAFKASAMILCIGAANVRNGAEIVTEQPARP